MTDLPAYTGTAARCPKCGFSQNDISLDPCEGHLAIATHFIRRYEQPPPPQPTQFNQFWPTPPKRSGNEELDQQFDALGINFGQEALLRGCTRCSYIWAEACIDDPDIALRNMMGK